MKRIKYILFLKVLTIKINLINIHKLNGEWIYFFAGETGYEYITLKEGENIFKFSKGITKWIDDNFCYCSTIILNKFWLSGLPDLEYINEFMEEQAK